jgi:hypothetical protein
VTGAARATYKEHRRQERETKAPVTPRPAFTVPHDGPQAQEASGSVCVGEKVWAQFDTGASSAEAWRPFPIFEPSNCAVA